MTAPVRVRVWFVVGALAALHLFLHVGLSYSRGAPDLLTLALLLGAREMGPGRASVMGLFFGLLEDALSVLAPQSSCSETGPWRASSQTGTGTTTPARTK